MRAEQQRSDFGPRPHRNLLIDAEGLDQPEHTKKYGNDAGPNHCERPEDEDECDCRQRQLNERALDCGHKVPLEVPSTPTSVSS